MNTCKKNFNIIGKLHKTNKHHLIINTTYYVVTMHNRCKNYIPSVYYKSMTYVILLSMNIFQL